jgi:hypothetical protein
MLVALFVVSATSAQAVQRSDGSTPAPAQISQLVTNVPVTTLNQVGAGRISGPQSFNVVKLSRRLRSHGKAQLLTMNLAWCPHCAANSWALAVALSRFGTLTGLRTINTGTYYCSLTHSSCTLTPSPCYPNTHGLSFLDADYRSPYLHLAAVVLEDVRGHKLEQPTRSENAVINAFDPQGETPAVAIGGWGFLNSGYDPAALVHKTWTQIAGSLADPHSGVAQHIDGLANLFTAAICKATGGRPAAVCKSRGVSVAGAAHLH